MWCRRGLDQYRLPQVAKESTDNRLLPSVGKNLTGLTNLVIRGLLQAGEFASSICYTPESPG
jgi:hypothetical protein